MKKVLNSQNPEFGGASGKLLIALVILILFAHAGYNYVPVAYESESFKQEMETAVIQGTVVPKGGAKPTEAVKARISNVLSSFNLPSNTFIDVKEVNKVIQARVYFEKDVPILPFGLYDYKYVFDHTATPSGYLSNN